MQHLEGQAAGSCGSSCACQLNELEMDAVREICNIGMGHAATALSRLLNTRVRVGVPSVHRLGLHEIHDFVGGAELPVAGIMFAVTGDAQGKMALVLPYDCALAMIRSLAGYNDAGAFSLNELERSILKEVGNILVSAHLNAVSSLLNLTLLPSIPSLLLDMAGAVLDPILSSQCDQDDVLLLARADFATDDSSGIAGKFFVIPDPESLQMILKAAGVRDA